MSLRDISKLINLCHLDSGTVDKSKMISAAGVRKQKIKLGLEVLEEHKAKKGFKVIKMDGKSHESLLPHNKTEFVHTITSISEPDYQLVDLFDSESERAEDITNGMMKVIDDTESRESLLGLGTGKLKMCDTIFVMINGARNISLVHDAFEVCFPFLACKSRSRNSFPF